MKIVFPNFHFDLLTQMSFIFKDKLGWKTGLLGNPEFEFLGIQKAMSDPDRFDRNEQQEWIANFLGMELCNDFESVRDAEIIIVTTTDHHKKWLQYAKKHKLKTKIIFYCGNGSSVTPVYDMEYFWTANIPAYQISPSPNKLHWYGIFGEVNPAYSIQPTSTTHQDFSSFVSRIQNIYPASYKFIQSSFSTYKKMGGTKRINYFGQWNKDGMLHMGKYGQEDEVLQKMRKCIAVVHIKSTDAPGFVLMRALFLGKPLIVWNRFIENTKMNSLLTPETCIGVDSPEELSKALLRLENDFSYRSIGINGASAVRQSCSWNNFSRQFLPWIERVLK